MSLRRTVFSTNGDRYADVYSHFKNIMASGNVGGDSSSRVVWTGSNNFTSDGTHFDEVMLRIKDADAYNQYVGRFKFISNRKSSSRYASFLEPVGGGRAPKQTTAFQLGTALRPVDAGDRLAGHQDRRRRHPARARLTRPPRAPDGPAPVTLRDTWRVAGVDRSGRLLH